MAPHDTDDAAYSCEGCKATFDRPWEKGQHIAAGCPAYEAVQSGFTWIDGDDNEETDTTSGRSHRETLKRSGAKARASAGLPDLLGRLQRSWNDRNERLAFGVGVVMVGIAACGGASFDLVIGLAVLAFGFEGVRDIEGARERLNQTGLFGLSTREQKGLIRTKPYQFVVGAAISFVVTDLDLLAYVGLDACRLLSAIGPLV
jgi:hypothetical protein